MDQDVSKLFLLVLYLHFEEELPIKHFIAYDEGRVYIWSFLIDCVFYDMYQCINRPIISSL